MTDDLRGNDFGSNKRERDEAQYRKEWTEDEKTPSMFDSISTFWYLDETSRKVLTTHDISGSHSLMEFGEGISSSCLVSSFSGFDGDGVPSIQMTDDLKGNDFGNNNRARERQKVEAQHRKELKKMYD
ncbi:hypothetical protein AVEN_213262-1 [Araneus ventricosus]|uniref:Uncharacterized protein n=1 Tax=Araneus ventricosus TaxID=182803 RepID=A0A4Y2DFV7_ARAVE|nr:hypothetical protein AVEN_213262-1 [Araneus ventricosus]